MPVSDQIEHSLGFVSSAEAALGRQPTTAVDLGSGGGVPGLVLHSCWPDCQVLLVDGNQRRTEFLAEEIEGFASDSSVRVVRARVEELARDEAFRGRFEIVTARSFGPPAVTVECGAPLLTAGGMMIVSEPPADAEEQRWPVDGLALVGMARFARHRFDGRFGYEVLTKASVTPDRYPRRVGIPSKRPLF
jgi:16S rRNA (guanine527-N7)-methyltransferase